MKRSQTVCSVMLEQCWNRVWNCMEPYEAMWKSRKTYEIVETVWKSMEPFEKHGLEEYGMTSNGMARKRFGTVSRNRGGKRQNVSHAFPNFFALFQFPNYTHDPNRLSLFAHHHLNRYTPRVTLAASSRQVNKTIRSSDSERPIQSEKHFGKWTFQLEDFPNFLKKIFNSLSNRICRRVICLLFIGIQCRIFGHMVSSG